MAEKKITRQLSIFINDKEVKNSLGSIGREISKVKGKLREANDPADIKKYKAELADLRKSYGDVKDEIEGSNNTLEQAKGHWDNLLTGFLSGDLKQASAGLKGLLGNLKNITKAALAFIATPFGAALAGIAAIGLGVKKWVAFNLEIEKTNQLIRDLTQESGTLVDTIRIRAEVIKNTFEVDISKSVETAKSLVKSFNISYSEAFDLIEEGGIRGKLKNDEYLDSLKEYPIQFKNAGFSAQDFANIVATGIDLSIYSDKLPDAIKEFNLAITEQTVAAKEALKNAFGFDFMKKLLKDLKNGSITAKDALALIAAEAHRIGLNSQQTQQLTADLFKGAGEDAGGALKIYEALNIALNQQKKPLTEIQQIQKEQLQANKELNSVYTQLFASGSKGFNLWIQKGKLFATKTLLKILKGGVDLYNWFVDLNNESGTFSAILKSFAVAATGSFKVIGMLISGAWNGFKGLGNIVAGIFTLDLQKVKKGFRQGADNLVNVLKSLKTKVIEEKNSIVEAWNGKNKMKRFSLDDFIADDPKELPEEKEASTLNNTADQPTELTPEDKQIIESKKKLAAFLDQFDAEQKAKKEEKKIQEQIEGLEESEANQLAEELRLEAKYAKLEQDAFEEKELLKRLADAKKKELQDIEDKYEKIKSDKDTKAKEQELKRDLDQHKKQLDARRKLKNDIINGAISLAGQETKIGQALVAAKGLMASKEMLIQLGVLKGKAATALAEGTMSTAVGAANTAKVGFPQNIPLLISFAAQAVGIISAIKSATSTTEKLDVPSFYFGGPSGDKAIYNDQYGKVVGVVHDKEWIAPKFMTENPRYAPVIQWLEKERKKELGQFFEGGHSTDKETELVTIDSENNSEESVNLNATLYMLYNLLKNGIKTGEILIGDDQIQQFNERNDLLQQTYEEAKIN